MVKEVKVKFNGVEYRKPVLNTSDTFEFGWKIAPRITSLLTAIGFKVTDLQGENSKTFADVIEKIFSEKSRKNTCQMHEDVIKCLSAAKGLCDTSRAGQRYA